MGDFFASDVWTAAEYCCVFLFLAWAEMNSWARARFRMWQTPRCSHVSCRLAVFLLILILPLISRPCTYLNVDTRLGLETC